jgi:hypothetical protein
MPPATLLLLLLLLLLFFVPCRPPSSYSPTKSLLCR